MITYYAALNQTGGSIKATLTDSAGLPIPLADKTVRYLMWDLYTGAMKIDAPATIIDAAAGEVAYGWGATDFDEAGYYLSHWKITDSNGDSIYVPTDFLPDTYIKVIVGEFPADSYISTLQLMSGASAPEATDEQIWTDYAVGASRLFDRLCEVEAGFFNQAVSGDDGVYEKSFWGNDIDMLQLPPYVGAIEAENILIDDEEIEDDFRIVGSLTNQFFLINRDNDFDSDSVIKITARWGFPAVPADVQMIVRELAVFLWRQRDPHFSRISDTGIYEDLSPTVKATIKKFREKYSQMGAV